LHNKDLNNLYLSPHMIRVMRSRGMRLAEHIARMVQMTCIHTFTWRTWKEETTWENYE